MGESAIATRPRGDRGTGNTAPAAGLILGTAPERRSGVLQAFPDTYDAKTFCMRASEIVTRVVRDLDDAGCLLWIPDSKTDAGRRTLRVPPILRPYLGRLASGRASGELLFGQHWRDWPREWVQRICAAVGVPTVCAHSMRGLHSTLAMEAGVTGHAVAASLGHESVSTTVQSYAAPEAVAGARQQRTLVALVGKPTLSNSHE